ncbi:hypothetical protein MUCCIDRAFT_155379 [Mucor lusitanicus CBS 277.49]|uniref:Uncharacterized protein n=1 Tax=Mucor lusitanicus CBS 277.49 TaxID=747725 RepID=A0A168NT11_MUCCL|nr:hypothetical protein MUCCIDRAFT_155379 [Mucor lusitanicus CBS 277.49]
MEPSLSNSFMYTLKPVIVTCDPTPRLITEQANYLGLCGRFGASLRRIDMPPLRRHFHSQSTWYFTAFSPVLHNLRNWS